MTTLANEQEERFVIADRRRFSWARCRTDIAPFLTRQVTWRALAAGDIRSKYQRTFLGPWWITATNAITALIMGLVAGRFLGADTKTYLPNFMVSITIWNFIASSLGEACNTMISAGGMIKAVNMPILIHVMRMVQRNLIIFLHNIAIVPIIWLIFPWRIDLTILLCRRASLSSTSSWSAPQSSSRWYACAIVTSPPSSRRCFSFCFLSLPIIWQPSHTEAVNCSLSSIRLHIYYRSRRDPVMGNTPDLTSWFGSIGTVALLTAAMIYIYTRYRSRVVYWA